jgi:hypothetical protein
MIDESFLKSNFLGKDGFIWWIGRVAKPEVWRDKVKNFKNFDGDFAKNQWNYRCKVRIVGYHSYDENILKDEDLPWAHILTSASDGSPAMGGFGKMPMLYGGESVLGFFLDGEEAQQPVVVATFYRHPNVDDVKNSSGYDPFVGPNQDPSVSTTGNAGGSPPGTRIPFDGSGILEELKKEIGKGPAFELTSDQLAENIDFNSTVDLNLNTSTKVNFSDTKQNAGSSFKPVSVILSEIFSDDIAGARFLRKFDDLGPVISENGCGDNIIAKILAALNSFIRFLNRLESTIYGFIDPVLNLIYSFQEVENIACSIARLIASILKYVINGIRDGIMVAIGDLFVLFGITLPQPQQPIAEEAGKNVQNIIFCIFEKLLDLLIDFLCKNLKQLIGKSNNIPTCAAEEIAAAAIGKLSEDINSSLSGIFSGLDWLSKGMSKISDIIGKALNILNQILSFLTCDSLKCELSSSWDPFGDIELPASDEWNRVLSTLGVLSSFGSISNGVGYLSVYGSSDTPFKSCRESIVNPQDQSPGELGGRLPIGIKASRCIPPEIRVIGDGTGGVVIPIVSNVDGSILTFYVVDPGKGYSVAPQIRIIDKSNYGRGATAAATINPDGTIRRVYVIDEGIGYCPPQINENLVVPDLPPGGGGGRSVDNVGIVTDIVIGGPGIGYTPEDTIKIGDCVYFPILTDRGSIVGFKSVAGCPDKFNNSPVAQINSGTGRGASLFPVLQYTPQFNTSSGPVGIPTNQIINSIQCV